MAGYAESCGAVPLNFCAAQSCRSAGQGTVNSTPPGVQGGACREEGLLRDSLEAEREAVMDFLFVVIDKVALLGAITSRSFDSCIA